MTGAGRLVVVGALGLAACAGVLGLRGRAPRVFEHREHAVRGVACVRCHARVSQSDAEAPVDLPGAGACRTCHTTPHDTRDCGGCHGLPERRQRAAMAKEHLAFSHREHARHGPGDCARCHAGVLEAGEALTPPMATCLACHEHRAQWTARACLPCHRNLEDEHVRPSSHAAHGESFLARHGVHAAGARDLCESCHRESECAGCHGASVPALPSTLHLGEPRRADMHPEGFAARHALEARVDPALCTSCHREQTSCRDCHRARGLLEAGPERSSPHPRDWVALDASRSLHGAAARRDPASCASCHGGAGEALCVGCHREGGPGGSPHPRGFSSSKPTSELPCRLCHAGAR